MLSSAARVHRIGCPVEASPLHGHSPQAGRGCIGLPRYAPRNSGSCMSEAPGNADGSSLRLAQGRIPQCRDVLSAQFERAKDPDPVSRTGPFRTGPRLCPHAEGSVQVVEKPASSKSGATKDERILRTPLALPRRRPSRAGLFSHPWSAAGQRRLRRPQSGGADGGRCKARGSAPVLLRRLPNAETASLGVPANPQSSALVAAGVWRGAGPSRATFPRRCERHPPVHQLAKTVERGRELNGVAPNGSRLIPRSHSRCCGGCAPKWGICLRRLWSAAGQRRLRRPPIRRRRRESTEGSPADRPPRCCSGYGTATAFVLVRRRRRANSEASPIGPQGSKSCLQKRPRMASMSMDVFLEKSLVQQPAGGIPWAATLGWPRLCAWSPGRRKNRGCASAAAPGQGANW